MFFPVAVPPKRIAYLTIQADVSSQKYLGLIWEGNKDGKLNIYRIKSLKLKKFEYFV